MKKKNKYDKIFIWAILISIFIFLFVVPEGHEIAWAILIGVILGIIYVLGQSELKKNDPELYDYIQKLEEKQNRRRRF
mgnify:CR=1 FL=1